MNYNICASKPLGVLDERPHHEELEKMKIKIIVVILRAAAFSSPPERGKKTLGARRNPAALEESLQTDPGAGGQHLPPVKLESPILKGLGLPAGTRRIALLALPEAGEPLTWQPCPPPPAANGDRRGIVPSGGRRPHSPAGRVPPPRGPSPAGGAEGHRARPRRAQVARMQ